MSEPASETVSDQSPALRRTPFLRDAPDEDWAMEALERDKRESLVLAVRARWVALAIIAVLVPILNPRIEALYYEVLIGLFALIGWAQLRVGRAGVSRPELALMFCDLALMTFTFVAPNPLSPADWPLAVQYRFENFMYFYVLLAGAVLAYSWRTIFAMGTWTTGLWLGALLVAWLVSTPDPDLAAAHAAAYAGDDRLGPLLDPQNFNAAFRFQEVIIFLIVAGMLALASRRSQRLLLSQASAERERANLARYFSPNVVAELAQNDEPLKNVRSQNIGVLFVDIVGFTAYADSRSPEEVIRVLREFHGLMEQEVFRHDGTLDKYLGDGLMATFGTPLAGDQDALNALRCARHAARSVEAWNDGREAQGEPRLRASFGLHFGEVVLGDIGANRLEYAAIGSAVNVASRLEAMTRTWGATLVASDALVSEARRTAGGEPVDFAALERKTRQEIRGIAEPIDLWIGDGARFAPHPAS